MAAPNGINQAPDEASSKYRLLVVPAGKNDRMAEIMDQEGNIIKLIYCPHRLADARDLHLDAQIRQDLESLDAGSFAAKYCLEGPGA